MRLCLSDEQLHRQRRGPSPIVVWLTWLLPPHRLLGGSAGCIRTSRHIALHTFVAETFGDTPAAIEACFSTSTPPTIDGLPSMSCWQWTTMSCCQVLGTIKSTIHSCASGAEGQASQCSAAAYLVAQGVHLCMCDHARPLPEPVGSEDLVHVLDQEALGLRQEEGHEQLQAARTSR